MAVIALNKTTTLFIPETARPSLWHRLAVALRVVRTRKEMGEASSRTLKDCGVDGVIIWQQEDIQLPLTLTDLR